MGPKHLRAPAGTGGLGGGPSRRAPPEHATGRAAGPRGGCVRRADEAHPGAGVSLSRVILATLAPCAPRTRRSAQRPRSRWSKRDSMFDLARIYLFGFGALTIAGGVMGFVKAKSRASLIAGTISGVLL